MWEFFCWMGDLVCDCSRGLTVVGGCSMIKFENSMMGHIKHNTTIRRNVINEDVEEGILLRGNPLGYKE